MHEPVPQCKHIRIGGVGIHVIIGRRIIRLSVGNVGWKRSACVDAGLRLYADGKQLNSLLLHGPCGRERAVGCIHDKAVVLLVAGIPVGKEDHRAAPAGIRLAVHELFCIAKALIRTGASAVAHCLNGRAQRVVAALINRRQMVADSAPRRIAVLHQTDAALSAVRCILILLFNGIDKAGGRLLQRLHSVGCTGIVQAHAAGGIQHQYYIQRNALSPAVPGNPGFQFDLKCAVLIILQGFAYMNSIVLI